MRCQGSSLNRGGNPGERTLTLLSQSPPHFPIPKHISVLRIQRARVGPCSLAGRSHNLLLALESAPTLPLTHR